MNKVKVLEGLKVEDINYVFLTHHHLDHAINVALFPKAKVVDADSVLEYKDDFSSDSAALYASRKKVSANADFIIPGHGKMFKVEK